MPRDLTEDDKAALVELLKETIAADRFPLSPKIKRLKAVLAKLARRRRDRADAAAEAAGRAQRRAGEKAPAVGPDACPPVSR
jgi:hypothetical protein